MQVPSLEKEGKSPAYIRGFTHAYQDRCENVPCAGIGGLGNRHSPVTPEYIPEVEEFIAGYERCCEEMWGEGWKDAEFGWRFALTINA